MHSIEFMTRSEVAQSMRHCENVRRTLKPLHGDRTVFRFADAVAFRRLTQGFHAAVELARTCAVEPVTEHEAAAWVRGL